MDNEIAIFDLERSDEETTYLSEEGQEIVVLWAEELIWAGYDLINGNTGSFYQAAAWLIANDFSTYSVDVTAIALTFVSDKWEELKEILGQD